MACGCHNDLAWQSRRYFRIQRKTKSATLLRIRGYVAGPRYHLGRTDPNGSSASFCLPITLPVHGFGDSEGQTNPSSPVRDEILRRVGAVNGGLGVFAHYGEHGSQKEAKRLLRNQLSCPNHFEDVHGEYLRMISKQRPSVALASSRAHPISSEWMWLAPITRTSPRRTSGTSTGNTSDGWGIDRVV